MQALPFIKTVQLLLSVVVEDGHKLNFTIFHSLHDVIGTAYLEALAKDEKPVLAQLTLGVRRCPNATLLCHTELFCKLHPA